MTETFVDTSAWYPLADASHPDHPVLAAELRTRIESGHTIVTTNMVLVESHALMMRRLRREAALRFWRLACSPPNEVVYSTRELESRAHDEWLSRYDDHDFSLTDAVSFAVMSQRGIQSALTLDRHFRVAGFSAVP